MFTISARTFLLQIYILVISSLSLNAKTVKSVHVVAKNEKIDKKTEPLDLALQIKDFLASSGAQAKSAITTNPVFKNFNDVIEFAKNLEKTGKLDIQEFFLQNSELLKKFAQKAEEVSLEHIPFIQKCTLKQ